ncbi:MAG: spore germination protein [Vulcanibacillus sp.]
MTNKRKFKFFRKNNSSSNVSKEVSPESPLSKSLDDNVKNIITDTGNSADIIVRRIIIGRENKVEAAIIYTDGLVNMDYINNFLEVLFTRFPENQGNTPIIKTIKEKLLNIGEVTHSKNRIEIINGILTGDTAIIIDKCDIALLASTKGWEQRAILEPQNQQVIRGPRQSFVENIRTNTALIRRYLGTSKLRLDQVKVGKLSETKVGIMYIEGTANKKIVNEVKNRISKVDVDVLLGVGVLEELIQDNPLTWFPTIAYTERPDMAVGNLVEGRVLILVDGNPFVMVVPVTFFMFFQSADDYYLKYQISSLLRILRYITLFISVALPSMYVAITTYNQEILPTTILISLASQREGVPFPTFLETFILVFIFEVLREAGLRMPKPLGQAISIVGALVLGTAAVEAGIFTATVVIVVAMTAIADFTSPYIEISNAVRIARFIWLILSSIYGLFGLLFALIIATVHLASLRSFGVPYLNGFAPFNFGEQKDLLIRAPWFLMNNRPHLLAQKNFKRQNQDVPKPPADRQRRGNNE